MVVCNGFRIRRPFVGRSPASLARHRNPHGTKRDIGGRVKEIGWWIGTRSIVIMEFLYS